jgi:hypothetical protein
MGRVMPAMCSSFLVTSNVGSSDNNLMENQMSKDIVTAWAGDARGAEYGFIKAVAYALEQFKEKNNKPLYKMLAICNGKPYAKMSIVEKDRLAYAVPLNRVIKAALVGMTITYVVKECDFRVNAGEDACVDEGILEGLRMLATVPGMSIRHGQFKKLFPVVASDKPKKAKDADKVGAAMAKMLKDNGLSLADVADIIRAAMV